MLVLISSSGEYRWFDTVPPFVIQSSRGVARKSSGPNDGIPPSPPDPHAAAPSETITTATTAPGGQPTVAANGSGRYRTVQAAVDALPGGSVITIAPGTYRGTVRIPATKAGITLRGTTGRATDVVLSEGRRLGMKHLWLPVAANLTVGVSLGLPLFLYMREMARAPSPAGRLA